MKKRFTNAITKLYTAFHNGELHPECACQCAVGNILDQQDSWKHLSDDHGSLKLNYLGTVHERLGRKFMGYSPQELLLIERSFLQGCGYQLPLRHDHFKPEDPTDKAIQFEGLCAAITQLCKLEDIDDVTSYQRLFERVDHQPKFELAI